MSVIIGLKMGHLWQGWKLERGSWVRGQSSHSIGPMWREVLILAQRTATLSKGFLSLHYCYTQYNYSLYTYIL
jgi:hypothetical protein